MKEQQLTRILNFLAEDLVPAETDLWPVVQGSLGTGGFRASSLAVAPRRRFATGLTAFLIVGLVIAFMAATPQGHAWAQAVLRFFSRGSSNVLPYNPPTQSWVEMAPGTQASTPIPTPQAAFSAQCGDYAQAHCSVEQIRSMVGFGVTELATIPEGLYFSGATGNPDLVFLSYDSPGHHGFLTIFESPWTGSEQQTSWLVGPDAVVEKVTIGSVTGEYVKGSYSIYNGKGPMQWDPNLDVQTLRWVSNRDIYFNNDIFFEMQCSGMACKLDKNSLATLAASLTTQPVSALAPTMPPTPTVESYDYTVYHPLTVEQAEKQAGFHVWMPSHLPTLLLAAVGASYRQWHENYQIVSIVFPEDPAQIGPGTSFGLFIQEEPINDPTGCALCGYRIGDWSHVDETGTVVGGGIETVQIGNGTGQYVEGVWAASAANDGTWEWKPYEFVKGLRWQANGMAFEFVYYGYMEESDLIAIAESMK